MKHVTILAGIWWGFCCVAAVAETAGFESPANGNGMTEITSAELTYDYKRSIAVFETDVVVVDPQVRIASDTLTVLFDGTNQIKSVTALGNVRIRSDGKRATCRKAIYIAATGEVILTGDAKLMRGTDSVMGQHITFWLNEERVVCKPGRLVIYPDEESSGPKLLQEQVAPDRTQSATE